MEILKQIKNRDCTSTTEAKEDGLDRDDLELVDHIFDTLEIDNDGRVDIEKVLTRFSYLFPCDNLLCYVLVNDSLCESFS